MNAALALAHPLSARELGKSGEEHSLVNACLRSPFEAALFRIATPLETYVRFGRRQKKIAAESAIKPRTRPKNQTNLSARRPNVAVRQHFLGLMPERQRKVALIQRFTGRM